MTNNGNGYFPIDEVKSAARGRWIELLTTVGGFNGEDLDGQHQPCPGCGGTDRFRAFNDVNETGGVYCNQCFTENNGHGLEAMQWRNGWTFGETLKVVADYLGIQSTNENKPLNGSPTPFSSQFRVPFGTSTEAGLKRQADAFETFAMNKPPITAEAIRATGAKVVVWPNHTDGKLCIAFPASTKPDELTGYILRRIDGTDFPAIGNLQARKTHMLRGSHDGWIVPGGFERAKQAEVGWHVEGVLNALALFPMLPPTHAVITNICGAKSSPKNLAPLAGKTVFVVGDADVPGQEGATKFATKALAIADEVKLVTLPYDVSEDHGKDLRDYFNDGHTFAQLLSAAESAEEFQKPKRGKTSSQEKIQTPPADVNEWTFLPAAQGQTDMANARRFLKQHGDRVRFCHVWSKWLAWDGSRWQVDDGGAVLRLGKATADTVWLDAKGCLTDNVVKFAVATSGHGKLVAMTKDRRINNCRDYMGIAR